MSSLNHHETAALNDFDTQTLRLPGGKTAEVTANWHTWLAYEELQAFYGWSEEEILTLFVDQCEAKGDDANQMFEAVVAYAYAGCRPEPVEPAEGEIESSLPVVYPTLKR